MVKKKEEQSLVITATRNPKNIVEYTDRDCKEPGTIPTWFPATIIGLRSQVKPDEKIVVRNNILMIVKKTRWDNFLSIVKGLFCNI